MPRVLVQVGSPYGGEDPAGPCGLIGSQKSNVPEEGGEGMKIEIKEAFDEVILYWDPELQGFVIEAYRTVEEWKECGSEEGEVFKDWR